MAIYYTIEAKGFDKEKKLSTRILIMSDIQYPLSIRPE